MKRLLLVAGCLVFVALASTDAATYVVRGNGNIKSKAKSCAGVTTVTKAKKAKSCAATVEASCASAMSYTVKTRVK